MTPGIDEVERSLRAELDLEHSLNPAASWVTEASRDAFRHLASGTGDFNPLWWDDAYATASPRGGPTAPPIFLATVAVPYAQLLGLRPDGWTTLDGDIRWEYFEPVRPGDRLSADTRLVSVARKRSRALGEALLVKSRVDYRDQHARLLASATGGLWFFPRRERADAAPRALPDAHDEVVFDVLSRLERRGAEPRFLHDVQVHDELPVVVRPTLSTFELLAWCVGSGMSGFEPVARGERLDLAGLSIAEIEQRSVLRHLLPDLSRAEGLRGGFDIGTQRTAWLGQLVGDWMGDHGELLELYCRFGRLLNVGDTPALGGVVTETGRDRDRGFARIALWVRNQRGETVSDAEAVVSLPLAAG